MEMLLPQPPPQLMMKVERSDVIPLSSLKFFLLFFFYFFFSKSFFVSTIGIFEIYEFVVAYANSWQHTQICGNMCKFVVPYRNLWLLIKKSWSNTSHKPVTNQCIRKFMVLRECRVDCHVSYVICHNVSFYYVSFCCVICHMS